MNFASLEQSRNTRPRSPTYEVQESGVAFQEPSGVDADEEACKVLIVQS